MWGTCHEHCHNVTSPVCVTFTLANTAAYQRKDSNLEIRTIHRLNDNFPPCLYLPGAGSSLAGVCNDMLDYAANYGLSQPVFVIIEMSRAE